MDRVIIGSDIYNKTNPKELLKFKKFIENHKSFDVVIDGLNLTYMNLSAPKLLLVIYIVFIKIIVLVIYQYINTLYKFIYVKISIIKNDFFLLFSY